MKKLIVIFFAFSSFLGAAQDSSTIKVSAQIQARDIEYIAQYLVNNDKYEEVWDNIKAKFRVANPPSGNTNVTIDTVALLVWADLHAELKHDVFAKTTYNRVDAVLLALNQSWLTARINEQEAYFNDRQNALQALGRAKLRKQKN